MNPREGAKERITGLSEKLIGLSNRIHANPEIGFEEERACQWLSEELANAGFSVKSGICDLPTAFAASSGHGPLHVAICAEYDSLPGIGHACGHNIIAASAIGAGIAAAGVADDAGLTVTLIGTPAEEVGDSSGKVLLLERGAFAGAHVAMMIHPAPWDVATPKIIAASMFEVEYIGKEAHASAFPELGINAADALTIAQTAIGLLRQHIRPADRIHGITTHGGEAPNIVPARTRAKYIIRGETSKEMEELRPRVQRCFEAGALATGSRLNIIGGSKPYAEMKHDQPIAEVYRRNAEALGRQFPDLGALFERATGSTDMGNVSLAIPSIHPMIGIDSLPAVNHQPEFTRHCISDAANKALIDGALAMALTAIDLAQDSAMVQRLVAPR
jgi:amidohydrolase